MRTTAPSLKEAVSSQSRSRSATPWTVASLLCAWSSNALGVEAVEEIFVVTVQERAGVLESLRSMRGLLLLGALVVVTVERSRSLRLLLELGGGRPALLLGGRLLDAARCNSCGEVCQFISISRETSVRDLQCSLFGLALGLRGVLLALLTLVVGIWRPSSSASFFKSFAMRLAMRKRPSIES